ncbi:MAG: chemotaxis protein CheA [Spongiibacteraceae bacterium]
MNLDSARGALVQEARELLVAMEDALLKIETEGSTPDDVNAIFRAAHTIKGSAGLFGLDKIVSFTHVTESVLDRVRGGKLEMDADMMSLMLDCSDYMGRLIDTVDDGTDAEPDPAAREVLVQKLSVYLDEGKSGGAAPAKSAAVVAAPAVAATWNISLHLSPDVFRNGMDPLSFIRYLATIGKLIQVKTLLDKLPAGPDMDAETFYLGFDIELETTANQKTLEDAFEFVREDSQITIRKQEPEAVAVAEGAEAGPKAKGDGKKAADTKFIKVEAGKLDQLINLVGELVIASAGAQLAAHQTGSAAAKETTDTVNMLVEQIRDTSLNMRMVPIGEVFSRFPRVVRDVSKDLGKKIELVISGADTELDKTMVEKLADPLMHCVRNAMDHGIEDVAGRIAAGKSEAGTLRLTAFQESGSIIIEITDDGRGMDPTRIRNKAIERGLISADAEMTKREILNLIFAPGFSTAEKVTNISGRGVGMDVVRKNIEALRGDVELDSTFGSGSTVRIRLPLTLAIIDGFRVQVNDSDFVIPLEMIKECLDLKREDMHHELIHLRGESIPIVNLRDLFRLNGTPPTRESLVVVQFGHTRAGIVVDRLVGELQAVIKPLGQLFRHTRAVSGSTILGNGDVALLLDVQQVLNRAVAHHENGSGLHAVATH